MYDTVIWLTSDRGERVAPITDFLDLHYTRSVGGPGVCELLLPGDYDPWAFKIDNRIEIELDGRSEGSYLIRRRQVKSTSRSDTTILLVGFDGKHLLKRRLVAYAAGSAEARKTGPLDNVMKAIVRENLGTLAVAGRKWDTYVQVDANFSKGPSDTVAFSYDNVFETLQKLSANSAALGTPVYFDMVPTLLASGVAGWTFKTAVGQLGRDRRNELELSREAGTLGNPELDEDYGDEVTHIYAGGAGEGSERMIRQQVDSARSLRSAFGRIEGWWEDTTATAEATLIARANQELRKGRPSVRFKADLRDTDGCRYGVDWDMGDLCGASYLGRTFDALIRLVEVHVSRDQRSVGAMIEAESLI